MRLLRICKGWEQQLRRDDEYNFMSILFSVWTVLVAIVFFGIVIWVLCEKKENFDAAARIPFEEDDPILKNNEEDE